MVDDVIRAMPHKRVWAGRSAAPIISIDSHAVISESTVRSGFQWRNSDHC